jgi:acylglycerol lipase
MGHSMGGGEVLCYAAQGPAEIRQHIRGYLLESPFVEFDPKSKPSALTVFFARLAEKLFPLWQRYSKLDPKLICRDAAICAQFDTDPLCHDTGTLQALASLIDRTIELSSGKVMIPDDAGHGGVTRIWIAHGDADGICSYAASKKFSERQNIKDKTFKQYPGYFHRSRYSLCFTRCKPDI